MRFGAFLLAPRYPGQDVGAPLDASLAAAVAAEDAGFDDVWIAEHHFMSYGVCPSAVTMAGYLLGATRRITVGTAVSVLSTQHPVALAEQAALLDRLSGGWFVLGVGRGGPWVELDVFGTGLERWERGYPAALDVLLAALRTGRVCDPLRTGQVADDLELVPRPRGDLPVITAVTSEGGLRAAADRGLPMLLGMHADDEEKAALTARYAQLAPDAASRHVSAGIAHVADSTAEAVATVRSALPRWLGPGLAGYRRADGVLSTPRDPDAYATCSAGCTRWAAPSTASALSPRRRSAPASSTSSSWWRPPASCPGRWRRSAGSARRCCRGCGVSRRWPIRTAPIRTAPIRTAPHRRPAHRSAAGRPERASDALITQAVRAGD